MAEKSTGQWVGAIVGTVVGYFVGYPALGLTIGSAIGGAVDPPKGPTIKGPRLDDLSAQTASYGAQIGRTHGTVGVTGNIMWVEGNELREVVSTRTEGGKGGGGAEVEEATYYATFAVRIADNKIGGVRRIWINGQLLYNTISDDLVTNIANAIVHRGFQRTRMGNNRANQGNDLFGIYYGDDDQEPDPRIEAEMGVGKTPAWRGSAYAVFYDLPLKEYQNTLATMNVQFEVVGEEDDSGPLLLQGDVITTEVAGVGDNETLQNTATWYITPEKIVSYQGVTNIRQGEVSDGAVKVTNTPWGVQKELFETEGLDILHGESDVPVIYLGANPDIGSAYPPTRFQIRDNVVVAYNVDNEALMRNLDYDAFVSGRQVPISVEWQSLSVPDIRACAFDPDNRLIYAWTFPELTDLETEESTLWVYDEALNLVDSWTTVLGTPAHDTYRLSARMWVDNERLYLTCSITDSTTEFVELSVGEREILGRYSITWPESFPFGDGSLANSFMVQGDILVASHNKGHPNRCLHNRYKLRQYDATAAVLSDLVSSELQRSELITESDIDVSALAADEVTGYRLAGVQSPRANISPLVQVYQFDLVPSGYQIKAVKRGGGSLGAIDWDDLGAHVFGAEPGDVFGRSLEMDNMLPSKITVNYLDANRAYQQNSQPSYERTQSLSANQQSMDVPLVMSADAAAGIGDTMMDLAWLERQIFSLTLPQSYRYIEIADIYTVDDTQGNSYRLRIGSVNNQSNGLIAATAFLESAAIYTPNASGDQGDAVDSGTIPYAGESTAVLMDLPLLRYDDDSPGFATAVYGPSPTWPGAILYASNDGGATWQVRQAYNRKVTLGKIITPASGFETFIVDTDASMDVRIDHGELESVTGAINSGLNYFAYGSDNTWGIGQFETVSVDANGIYTLTNLLLGLRGTEHVTQAAGDWFVLLDDPDIVGVGSSVEALDVQRHWRVVTSGQTIDDAESQTWAYTGNNLKPLSPIQGSATLDSGDNSWDVSWVRRDRHASSVWKNGVERPMSETTETYQIDVMDGSTVVNTYEVTDVTEWTYSEANQITDFGSAQGTISVNVYQMSSRVGRGYALQITG